MLDIRAELTHTWYAFFARHPQPRPIQLESVAPLLAGKCVLLASATASGKTEAYAAPLVERWHSDMCQGTLRLAVVCPTRALVNDLQRRLEIPLRSCGVKALVRTGDHPNPLAGAEAGVVLTTPESLDSLLTRHPADLASIRAIVLDELHVLEGSSRGDHLCVLLQRLSRIVERDGSSSLQRVAATATVGESLALREKYLGPNAEVVEIAASRDIDYSCCCINHYTKFPALIMRELPKSGARKVLVFLPSRRLVEKMTSLMLGRAPFGSAVFAHHGSLARNERERVEGAFLRAGAAICFATSTLEVGIDIGDVDIVILVGATNDVSSYLQRIGRGNRRNGKCRVLAVARCPLELLSFAHLNHCARSGKLLSHAKAFRSSVLVQQSFSLVFQNPRQIVAPKAIYSRLPAFLHSMYTQERLGLLLANIARKGYLRPVGEGLYAPEPILERLFTLGKIHHNIDASSDTVEVVDSSTRQVVGVVARDENTHINDLTLAGRSYDVVADKGRTIFVRGADSSEAKFKATGPAPAVTYEFAQDFGRFLGFDPQAWLYVREGTCLTIGHFLGTHLGRLLADVLITMLPVGTSTKGICHNAYLLSIPFWGSAEDIGALPDLSRVGSVAVNRAFGTALTKYQTELGLGPWVRYLPKDWCLEEMGRMARVELLIEACHKRRFVKMPAVSSSWSSLLDGDGSVNTRELVQAMSAWALRHQDGVLEEGATQSDPAPVTLTTLWESAFRGGFDADLDELPSRLHRR